MRYARLSTVARILAKVAEGLVHTHHPVLVHMDNWRRPQRGVARLPPQSPHAAPAPPAS